jgi:hypothetical protein
MFMVEDVSFGFEHNGRMISEEELDQICETAALFPNLSLKELGSTISEHLQWYTATGTLKRDACVRLLMKLEATGVLQLSQRQKRRPRPQRPQVIELTEATEPNAPVEGTLESVGAVEVEPVTAADGKTLWNEYVQRYHPLGYKRPFGYRLRYFISSDRGRLGCLLVNGAAKALGVRDRWIGWTDQVRLRNLSWVVGNNRFLIFPWVRVRNLASHVLGQLTARLIDDWERRWGYHPVLMESFVDPARHEGSCYKAAGWRLLGMTTGEGLVRPGKHYTTSPKMIFVKPLCADFRSLLCSPDLHRRAARRVD